MTILNFGTKATFVGFLGKAALNISATLGEKLMQ
jgi:hypothetical protein